MKKLTVDGITFETTKEAKAAERELEAIEKIRGRMDVTDPTYAKVLYEKLIEKEMLHTKVGDKFLAELLGYFGAEEAQKAADAVAAEEAEEAEETVAAETAGVPAEQEGERDIPYLYGTDQAEPAAAAGEAYLQEETAVEEAVPEEPTEEKDVWGETTGAGGSSQEMQSLSDTQTVGQPADETDDLDAVLFGNGFSVMPEEETEEPVEEELDAFMKEYGLLDEEDAQSQTAVEGTAQPAEEDEDEALSPEELEAFMGEYGVSETPGPEAGEAENRPAEEDKETDTAELNALVNEYSGDDAGAEEEPQFHLNLDEKEEPAGREEAGFELNLDEANLEEELNGGNLNEEEPDDDTLLAQARALKKELHQEDLSEVFSAREEGPEKKRFSLYGVLLVSILLNVILAVSMVVMVQVFKNSDNRNILNYERILEQEYQTATPTDASDLQ